MNKPGKNKKGKTVSFAKEATVFIYFSPDADDTNEESDLATVPAPQKNKMLFNWRTKIDFFSGENQDSYSAKKVKKSEVQSVASPSMAGDCIVIAKESQV